MKVLPACCSSPPHVHCLSLAEDKHTIQETLLIRLKSEERDLSYITIIVFIQRCCPEGLLRLTALGLLVEHKWAAVCPDESVVRTPNFSICGSISCLMSAPWWAINKKNWAFLLLFFDDQIKNHSFFHVRGCGLKESWNVQRVWIQCDLIRLYSCNEPE